MDAGVRTGPARRDDGAAPTAAERRREQRAWYVYDFAITVFSTSVLTVFLGPESMREFGLPMRPPWAHAYLVGLNSLRYRVLRHLPGGQDRLWRWGGRRAQWLLDSYFQGEREDVGKLTV